MCFVHRHSLAPIALLVKLGQCAPADCYLSQRCPETSDPLQCQVRVYLARADDDLSHLDLEHWTVDSLRLSSQITRPIGDPLEAAKGRERWGGVGWREGGGGERA